MKENFTGESLLAVFSSLAVHPTTHPICSEITQKKAQILQKHSLETLIIFSCIIIQLNQSICFYYYN